MTHENFIYWLQGFLEIANPEKITKEQVDIIKKHMELVMTKSPITYPTVRIDYPYSGSPFDYYTQPDSGTTIICTDISGSSYYTIQPSHLTHSQGITSLPRYPQQTTIC